MAEELLLDQVAAANDLTVEDDAVDEQIREEMERREGGKGRPVMSVIQQMRQDGSYEGLRVTMRRRLALEHLKAHATIDADRGEDASATGG